MSDSFSLDLAPQTGGAELIHPDGRRAALHPIWLRERVLDAHDFDPVNRQRLFEPPELPADLTLTHAEPAGDGTLALRFGNGDAGHVDPLALARELGWESDPEAPPAPEPWEAATAPAPEAAWAGLDDPARLEAMLADFHRHGFCLLRGTPTEPGSLAGIARRFGYLRDTNFGPLFDVITKPNPIDLAYTGRHLSAHADNPYRRPIPGIQFLHCLENGVAGGLSTLTDGFAVARRIEAEMPEAYAVLAELPVRFRYEVDDAIMVGQGPLIEHGPDGALARVRFSTRVDYVPPRPAHTLDLYYRARARFHELANDPAFQISFPFEPGLLLMMDNHRMLHGRTAFDSADGRRHLQGCYIDHDGPDSLYRLLRRDGRLPERAAAAA